MVAVARSIRARGRVTLFASVAVVFGGWAALAACTRAGNEGGVMAAVSCTVDDDCAWASPCCDDCIPYSGRPATYPITTSAKQERAMRACDYEACADIRCSAPPPCALDLDLVCDAGRCVVKAGLPGGNRVGKPSCNATGCGPPPTFGDPACDRFEQALYERCACLATGTHACDLAAWPLLCKSRATCARADLPPGIAKALADCEQAP
jgi:hypothetical protein